MNRPAAEARAEFKRSELARISDLQEGAMEVARLREALQGVIAAIEAHTSRSGICKWNRWEHDAVVIARAALARSDR